MEAEGDERERAVFGTALRAASTLWWAGCWFRGACVAGMWMVLAVAGDIGSARAVGQLSFTSIAVAIAFVHARSGALWRLSRVRLPLVERLTEHLSGTTGRATLDASGAGETIGAFLALWLFTGAFPLPGLTQTERVAGIVLGVLYSLSAASQAMIDPGWYSLDHPPSRALRRLRAVLPFIFSGMLVGYLYPYNDSAAQLPMPLYLVLCATPFGYYALWAAFDLMLHAAAHHTVARRREWRQQQVVDNHSLMRNGVDFLKQYVNEPDPDPREIRRLAAAALLQIEEARRDVIDGQAPGGARTFGDLWELVMRVIPSTRRERCTTDADSRSVRFSLLDYEIARRVLLDLLSNALNSGARRIEVRCMPGEPGDTIRLTVVDDGPGVEQMPTEAPTAYGSSRILRFWLNAYGGDIAWHDRGREPGTVVAAHWRRDGLRTKTRVGEHAR